MSNQKLIASFNNAACKVYEYDEKSLVIILSSSNEKLELKLSNDLSAKSVKCVIHDKKVSGYAVSLKRKDDLVKLLKKLVGDEDKINKEDKKNNSEEKKKSDSEDKKKEEKKSPKEDKKEDKKEEEKEEKKSSKNDKKKKEKENSSSESDSSSSEDEKRKKKNKNTKKDNKNKKTKKSKSKKGKKSKDSSSESSSSDSSDSDSNKKLKKKNKNQSTPSLQIVDNSSKVIEKIDIVHKNIIELVSNTNIKLNEHIQNSEFTIANLENKLESLFIKYTSDINRLVSMNELLTAHIQQMNEAFLVLNMDVNKKAESVIKKSE